MKKIKSALLSFLLIAAALYSIISINGCAQIGAPTGGAKDTIPPVLIRAIPENKSTNFTGNKITLNFNEYINLNDVQSNVLISPFQTNQPQINFNFKTVTVKLRDTLLPNTTYTINFGNSITDLNENNPLPNLMYVFSTGPQLDSLSLSGNVTLAENGKTDSTMIVMLYRNLSDTAVRKTKPAYISRVHGDGSFRFDNLPDETFNVFALRDGDNSRNYNAKTEAFAFADSPVVLNKNISGIQLFAYQEEKPTSGTPAKSLAEKRLRYTTTIVANKQDILQPLTITFNNPLKGFSDSTIRLTDSLYASVNTNFKIDSTRKIVSFDPKWIPGTAYRLIIQKNISDSSNNTLTKNDTLAFETNTTAAYGRVVLRFKNLPMDKNPVLQFFQGDKLTLSFPLVSAEFKNDLIPPAEYELRILYDDNKNGMWDPGNYESKKQPEKAITLSMKLPIKADWDNERDINL